MPRRDRQSFAQVDFRGGICLEPENARPNQVLDALNVWAPDGKLVKRPGSTAAFYPFPRGDTPDGFGYDPGLDNTNVSFSGYHHVAASTFGTGTLVNNTQRIYLGSTNAAADFVLIQYTGTPAATTSVEQFFCEYWNGTEWRPCWFEYGTWDTSTGSSLLFQVGPGFLNDDGSADANYLIVLPGADWASSTPGTDWNAIGWTDITDTSSAAAASAGYFLRLTSVNGTGFVSNSSTLTFSNDRKVVDNVEFRRRPRFTQQLQFSSGSLLCWFFQDFDSGSNYATMLEHILLPALTHHNMERQYFPSVGGDIEPGTVAIIPEFDKALVAIGERVFELTYDQPGTVAVADVNTDSNFIGTGAPFDSSVVALEAAVPAARYIQNFKGVIFAVVGDFQIQWSGNILQGGYNVWPTANFDNLSEADNSPISGMNATAEHPVLYKRDSIWIMVFGGTNPSTGQPIFVPTKVVAGRGTVANASVQAFDGKNVFLAEDGFYLFDGTPNILPLSTSIDEMVQRINWARVKFGASVYWKTRRCYLFSCAVDGSETNNFVFCYDTTNNAWWFWDDINVERWLLIEDNDDIETLYYSDIHGRMYRMVEGATDDHGDSFECMVQTNRLGYLDDSTKRWSSAVIDSTDTSRSLTVDLEPGDEASTTATLALTTSKDPTFGTTTWGQTGAVLGGKRRWDRVDFRRTDRWATIKVSQTSNKDKFEVTGVRAFYQPLGRR